MRNLTQIFFWSLALPALLISTHTTAETTESAEQPFSQAPTSVQPPAAPFAAFTGKVTKNKVRMRYQPNLESPILQELNEGTLLVVIGESDEFYTIQPPSGVKAYVFRTFILDNVVEGNRVNIRLEPNLEAPVIGQLNSGDHVNGTVSSLNSKWLEIAVPSTTCFYIAKEYIDKIGGPHMIAALEKRREEVTRLINSTYLLSQTEMQKTFPEIHFELISENYNKVIKHYSDFPEQVARAKELLSTAQNSYMQKKIAYLEAKARSAQQDLQSQNTYVEQLKIQEERLKHLEQQKLELESKTIAASASSNLGNETLAAMQDKPASSMFSNVKMAVWMPLEEKLFAAWQEKNKGYTQEDFYQQEKQNAIALRGILEPYSRSIKNKPGDFLLVNQANHQPIAFLYSTMIDLYDKIGQEITIQAIPRPNNHFAFPAYFVISLD